ncbi:hypothetical protein J6590_077250 [Homalodisca vitripennis]|nr:hypothetical protein J6590_077250 [Homalodisca vitripennis]
MGLSVSKCCRFHLMRSGRSACLIDSAARVCRLALNPKQTVNLLMTYVVPTCAHRLKINPPSTNDLLCPCLTSTRISEENPANSTPPPLITFSKRGRGTVVSVFRTGGLSVIPASMSASHIPCSSDSHLLKLITSTFKFKTGKDIVTSSRRTQLDTRKFRSAEVHIGLQKCGKTENGPRLGQEDTCPGLKCLLAAEHNSTPENSGRPRCISVCKSAEKPRMAHVSGKRTLVLA